MTSLASSLKCADFFFFLAKINRPLESKSVMLRTKTFMEHLQPRLL